MTLTIYLFNKFIKAIIICLGISYSIFFIFSLLGYLGEKFSFKIILYLSALNSLQIFTYIPSYLYILSFCFFIINLKSKNELIVVKEYIKLTNLFIIILPILFLFTLIDVKKEILSTKIENIKSKLLNSKNFDDTTRVIITTEGDIKKYAIFNGYDDINKNVNQYLKFEIKNQNIFRGELSTDLNLYKNDLYSHESTIYENNNFRGELYKKKLFINFSDYFSNNFEKIQKNKGDSLNSKYNFIQSIIFCSLFYLSITMIFFSKKILSRDINTLSIFLLVLSIFLYYLLVSKIILNNLHYLFQIISVIIFILVFFKIKKYE